jgi:hypothetical protein
VGGNRRSNVPPLARIVRVLRWQPENERQVWQFAIVSGVSSGAVQATVTYYLLRGHWRPLSSLTFALVFTFVFGIGQLNRLRKRQDAH